MLVKYLSVPFMFITLGLNSDQALAIEPLSSQQLGQLCADYQTESNSQKSIQCARYIKGFIDGAIAADSDVAKNKVAADKSMSSFKERAIRTRIGIKAERDTNKSIGEFCLGKSISILNVVKTVATKIDSDEYHQQSALSAMQAILKENYPCKSN